MKKQKTRIRLLPLSISVLVLSLALVFLIEAWTEPAQDPPGGNVSAPINSGGAGQVKSYIDVSNKGWLGIATDAYDPSYGLTVGNAVSGLGIKTAGDIYVGGRDIDGNNVLRVEGTSFTDTCDVNSLYAAKMYFLCEGGGSQYGRFYIDVCLAQGPMSGPTYRWVNVYTGSSVPETYCATF
jgi:hypothetical protein